MINQLPKNILQYMINGKKIIFRNHVTMTYRLNDFVFDAIGPDKDFFTSHIFLSKEAYESLKKRRYGRIMDNLGKKVDFLLNIYSPNGTKIIKELFVVRKEDKVYRIIGYYRLSGCIAYLNSNVFDAMKKYLIKYKIELDNLIPKVFKESILYIE